MEEAKKIDPLDVVLSARQRRILDGLVFFHGAKVDHEQLAARLGLSWEIMEGELFELECKTGAKADLLWSWWKSARLLKCR